MAMPNMSASSATRGSSSRATRQIWRSLRYATSLAPFERGRALLDESRRRRAVVLALAAARMAECFRVHHIAEAGALGEVHVLLHIAERDAWPTRQRQRERARGVLELGIGDQPGHEAERLRLGAAQDGRGEVELARLGGTDELCQEIAAAEIAGQCHLGKGGGEPRGIAGDAQVAGKRQRQACAGGAQHGDGGLRYLVQEAGGLHALAQAAGALIEALAAPFGHGLDVAAGAEGASG